MSLSLRGVQPAGENYRQLPTLVWRVHNDGSRARANPPPQARILDALNKLSATVRLGEHHERTAAARASTPPGTPTSGTRSTSTRTAFRMRPPATSDRPHAPAVAWSSQISPLGQNPRLLAQMPNPKCRVHAESIPTCRFSLELSEAPAAFRRFLTQMSTGRAGVSQPTCPKCNAIGPGAPAIARELIAQSRSALPRAGQRPEASSPKI